MILFFTSMLFAQQSDLSIQGSAEELYMDQDGTDDELRDRSELLEELRLHPVNVLTPSYGELLRIPFISPLLAESIILFTDTVRVESVEQLRNASLMTPAIFERIVPYITADDPSVEYGWSSLVPNELQLRTRYEQKLQPVRGFQEGRYSGSPYSSYQRVKIGTPSVAAAGMMEKDVGEMFRDRFVSRYVEIQELGVLRKLVIGNFSVTSGQGLVLAGGMSAAKGSDAAGQVRKRGSAISASVSTNEFRYFDGAAVHASVGGMDVTGFYSRRDLPASVDSTGEVTSFYTSGLFRNDHELRRKERVREEAVGGSIRFPIVQELTLTLTGVQVNYGASLVPALYQSQGKRELSSGSFSGEAHLGRMRLFGEIASNDAVLFSKVAGVSVPVNTVLQFSYLHRSYAAGYSAPFARPFSSRSDIGDGEAGDYLGFEFRQKGTTFAAYADVVRFPPVPGSFPSQGSELFAVITHDLSDRSEISFQTKRSVRLDSDESERSSYRFTHLYRIGQRVSLAQRLETVRSRSLLDGTEEAGMLASMDGQYRSRNKSMAVRARMTWFQSASYASRLFHYEPDVPGNLSNPPLYGTGLRWFILLHLSPFEQWSIGFKYAETKKLHEMTLGTGDDSIEGNLESKITMQIDFRF